MHTFSSGYARPRFLGDLRLFRLSGQALYVSMPASATLFDTGARVSLENTIPGRTYLSVISLGPRRTWNAPSHTPRVPSYFFGASPAQART